MTAEEKIRESDYNLNKLKRTEPMTDEYFYEFNCFIASTRSILDHLLDDYNVKYNLGIPLDIRYLLGEFRKKSQKNPTACNFLKWYDFQYDEIIKNSTYGFLIEKRNLLLHRKTVKPKSFKLSIEFPKGATLNSTEGESYFPLMIGRNETTMKITTVDAKTGESKEREVEAKSTIECYLEENPNETIETICALFLDRIKKLVSDAHSQFD